MFIKNLKLHDSIKAADVVVVGVLDDSLWTLLLMSHQFSQHHLDFTFLVPSLASVLD